MGRPPFNPRFPVIMVLIAGAVIIAHLGLLPSQVRRMSSPPPSQQSATDTPLDSRYEERSAGAFDWQLELGIEQCRFEALLRDGQGEPVAAGQGEITLYLPPHQPQSFALEELSAGRYTAELPCEHHGQVSARVRIAREQAHMVRGLIIDY